MLKFTISVVMALATLAIPSAALAQRGEKEVGSSAERGMNRATERAESASEKGSERPDRERGGRTEKEREPALVNPLNLMFVKPIVDNAKEITKTLNDEDSKEAWDVINGPSDPPKEDSEPERDGSDRGNDK